MELQMSKKKKTGLASLGEGPSQEFLKLKKDLKPFIKNDPLARLGLSLVGEENIVKIPNKYNYSGWATMQDISAWKGWPKDKYQGLSANLDRGLRDALKEQGRDPASFLTKEGYVPSYVVYSGKDRQDELFILSHELRHIADQYLSRSLEVDDDPEWASTVLGEPYARGMDRSVRRRLNIPYDPSTDQKKQEAKGRAISRYKGDPFRVGVGYNQIIQEQKMREHPVQEAARRELIKRGIELPQQEAARSEPVTRDAESPKTYKPIGMMNYLKSILNRLSQ